MEEDLEREKWKTTSKKMEEELKKIKLKKWKTTSKTKQKMKDDLKHN